MNQEQFTQHHQKTWKTLSTWLNDHKTPDATFDFPHCYREVCQHFALAQTRKYSQPLIDQLGQLVLRSHQQLYQRRAPLLHQLLHFFGRGFPRLIRQEWRIVAISASVFFGSLIAMIVAIQVEPELAFSVINPEQIASIEGMHSPEERQRIGRERDADSDIMMFGYYIKNNTGIGFRTFAGGLLLGIGSLFFLLFNGVFIGAVAGHLTQIGYIDTFWGFVAGHSAAELTAIALSGAAGLKLGQALIQPGRKSRVEALKSNAVIAVNILYGAAALFLIAAFIEAFWSSMGWIPAYIKYSVGIILWTLLILYFVRVGGSTNAD